MGHLRGYGGDIHGGDIHGGDLHGGDLHGGDIYGGDIHTVLVHLHVSELLVLGVARQLSVRLVLVDKEDFLCFLILVEARGLLGIIGTNVSFVIARVTPCRRWRRLTHWSGYQRLLAMLGGHRQTSKCH